jgi:flagellar hook-basal body complex protein FliE
MNITGISPASIPAVGPAAPKAQPAQQVGQTFAQALSQLSETQLNSDDLLQKLAAGEDLDIHQVMIAAEETDVNFRVAMAIRDRLVEAYHEVMRMAV